MAHFPRPVVQTIAKDEPDVPPDPDADAEDEPEENSVLKKHNFPTLNDVEENKLDIATIIVSISQYNKTVLGSQLAQLTKKGLKDSPLYQSIQDEIQVLKNYKNNLLGRFDNQKVLIEKTGAGLLKIGRYYANKEDIKRGMLKIRKKNKAKVRGIDDVTELSEGLKHLLLKRYDPKLNYSNHDYTQYKKICDLTGLKPKKYSKVWDKIYVTTVVDAQKRLVNAIGEMRAGNNNPEIKNEVVTLSDFLLKNHKIDREEYKNLMANINE